MSWTTPVVPVSGTLITAAWGTTSVVDNLLELRSLPSQRCDAYHNTTLASASSGDTAITFNSETVDTNTMHDTSASNDRVYIKTGYPGAYLVRALVNHVINGGWNLSIAKNGTKLVTQKYDSTDCGSMTHMVYGLIAGDYLSVIVNVTGGNAGTTGSATAVEGNRIQVTGPFPPS